MKTDETGSASERASGPGRYLLVWGILLAGTALTVAAASVDFAGLAVLVCLAIAAGKSCLVLLYFMHLRHEPRLLIKLVMPIALVVLTIFIGLTFVDVVTR